MGRSEGGQQPRIHGTPMCIVGPETHWVEKVDLFTGGVEPPGDPH